MFFLRLRGISSRISGFLPLTKNHAGRQTGYAELPFDVNECTDVCVHGLVSFMRPANHVAAVQTGQVWRNVTWSDESRG